MHVMMVCITGQNVEVISWIADYVKSEIAVFTIKSVTFAYPWAIFATAFFSFTQNKVGEKFLCSNKKKKNVLVYEVFFVSNAHLTGNLLLMKHPCGEVLLA